MPLLRRYVQILALTVLFVFSSAHADLVKTATGDCYITSTTPIEGGYHDPTKNYYWKYVPCDSAEAKANAESSRSRAAPKKNPKAKPGVKLKSSLKGVVSSIRKKIGVCLPFALGSCSRAPDTIPVTWLPANTGYGGLASRVTGEGQSGSISLNPDVATLFPKLIESGPSGLPMINFEKVASICQAFRNDPRYVNLQGQVSRRPLKNSIVTDYDSWWQLSTICHELIHMGECASCLGPIGSEKKAFEFEKDAAANAGRVGPESLKGHYAFYEHDRDVYVYYTTCRLTQSDAQCFQMCVLAGFPSAVCTKASSTYGTFGAAPIGDAHEHHGDKPVFLGTLKPAEAEASTAP